MPDKLSNRLWVSPTEFLITTHALEMACFGFSIAVVGADAGYFTIPVLNFIRVASHAIWMIDYNLCRRGKRYFGLEAARWTGLVADYQQTALVYSVMLGVALVAHRHQRPELAGSRTRVLAAKTIP